MDPPHINYVDHKSILVINPTGMMRQLFVPFRVQVLYKTSSLEQLTWVLVEEVQPHAQYKLIYRITTHWWPYHLFRIHINF